MIYLLDLENVGVKHLDYISKGDTIWVLKPPKVSERTIKRVEHLKSRGVEIEMFDVLVGTKNALDFQLSALLGYLIGKHDVKQVTIISNDKGYRPLVSFAKLFNCKVFLKTKVKEKRP